MLRTRSRNFSFAGSGGSLPPYEGFVAGGCRISNRATAGALTSMFRSPHPARTALTSAKVLFGNVYADYAGEHNPAGTCLIEASIEYPAGTMTRLTFGGADTYLLSGGATILSDDCSVSIPKDALFWVRLRAVTATGAPYVEYTVDNGTGDGTSFGAAWENTADNKVMSGTINDTFSRIRYFPLGIIGQTTAPSILLIGDSISEGISDSFDGVQHAVGYTERAIEPYFGYSKVAAAGESGADFIATHTVRQAIAQYCTHVLCEYGLNDLGTDGLTAAQTITNLQTIAGYFPDKTKIQFALTGATTSTDNWATLGNQTPSSAKFDYGGDRDTVNTAILADTVGFDSHIDLRAGAMVDAVYWKTDGTARKYVYDGTHPSQFGYKAMAALFNSSSITR